MEKFNKKDIENIIKFMNYVYINVHDIHDFTSKSGYVINGFINPNVSKKHSNDIFSIEETKFHCSWDWLMVVVNKIEIDNNKCLDICINNDKHYEVISYYIDLFNLDNSKSFKHIEKYKFNTYYKAVMSYINYFNKL